MCAHENVQGDEPSTIVLTGDIGTASGKASTVLSVYHSEIIVWSALVVTSTCHSISSAENVPAGTSQRWTVPQSMLLTAPEPFTRQRNVPDFCPMTP